VFNPVPAAAIEMTATAGCTTGFTDFTGNFAQINCRKNFFPEFSFFIGGIAAGSGKFAIARGRIVTNQTIDPFLRRKIEALLFPTITRMTAGTPAPVRLGGNSEIIEGFDLAFTLFISFLPIPGPVDRIMKLGSGQVMTFKTCFGYLRPGNELTIKFLKTTVISC
jgi:hypothetical protein